MNTAAAARYPGSIGCDGCIWWALRRARATTALLWLVLAVSALPALAHGASDEAARPVPLVLPEGVTSVVPDSGPDPILRYGARGPALVADAVAPLVRSRQLIVSFRKLDAAAARVRLEGVGGATVLDAIPGRPVFLVRFAGVPAVTATSQLVDRLGLHAEIERGEVTAEPALIYRLHDNQSGVSGYETEPWPFRNIGGSSLPRTNDADIDAEETLARLGRGGAGSPKPVHVPVVAVLDTGINPAHTALADALWSNPKEIPNNGIDDDGNGYADDMNGWNFGENNALLQDGSKKGHGTHVAGVIAARRTSGDPFRGVAPGAKVLVAKLALTESPALQALEPFPILKAIYYAIDQKVDVINMSFGSSERSPAFEHALEAALDAHIVTVAAAGNDGLDMAVHPVFPCLYAAVICVVASDASDRLAGFSNRDPGRELIAAPGENIHSTLPGGYGELSGTSMAAPHVAGAIAAMRSLYPALDVPALHARLYATADQPRTLDGSVDGAKRLNLYRALFAPTTSVDDDGYCDERPPDPQGAQQQYPRTINQPYANSGEPGIDGTSFSRAFTICTPHQLVSVQREDLDKVFVLRRNIEWSRLEPVYRQPIGAYVTTTGTDVVPFNGILDGNGFEIRRLTLEGRPSAGLFAELGPRSLVTNLRFPDVLVRFKTGGGVLAPKASGRIFNVQASGKVEGQGLVGGLVGQLLGGIVEGSFVDAEISGGTFVGGIAGYVGDTQSRPPPRASGSIERSQYVGRISGVRAGGIAGVVDAGRVSRSYAHVEITSGSTVGGLVGQLSCRAHLEDSYAEARLNGTREIGGLVGLLVNADVQRSFASAYVTAQAGAGGGAIGVRDDKRTISIDSVPPIYMCTAATSQAGPSTITAVYYNRVFAELPGGGGAGLTIEQLRSPASFPAFSRELWQFDGGAYPVLRDLPRSTSALD